MGAMCLVNVTRAGVSVCAAARPAVASTPAPTRPARAVRALFGQERLMLSVITIASAMVHTIAIDNVASLKLPSNSGQGISGSRGRGDGLNAELAKAAEFFLIQSPRARRLEVDGG